MTAALVGLICVAMSGVILIALHFWRGRGRGVLQGVGAILIALGLSQQTDAKSLGWLYVYGVVRVLISRFMTDREPEGRDSLTRTGRIHMLLAGNAFASIAVAASHLEWTDSPPLSPRWDGS